MGQDKQIDPAKHCFACSAKNPSRAKGNRKDHDLKP